jgi:pimeloyl-ACP methyl ester carboxylesterase
MDFCDRGIYLDTVPEMDEVYTQNAFKDSPKQLSDFMQLYAFAERHASSEGRQVDPNDAYGLTKEYETMITMGDRLAIWQWYVFENNLMEEDEKNLLDPDSIVEDKFREAQSSAFFETRLWIHETWEVPSNFLQRVYRLSDVPIWICQGLRDKVCPPQNAQYFADALKDSSQGTRSAPVMDRFIESGHEDTDLVMEQCLIESINEFLEYYGSNN